MALFYILIFLVSCFLLTFSSKWLVNVLLRISLFLKLKEFVVGFFMMAFAASLPNFFVGIIAALNKVPELSFGDVTGGNIIDLSLVIGLAALLSRGGLSAKSRTVQGSSIFTIFIGILPLLLIFDHNLSRLDGILLILCFVFYISWLFAKKERFTKVYDHAPKSINFKNFLKDLCFLILSVVLLLIGAKGMVFSANFFATALNLPLGLIGIFIVGLGNSLPEAFFSIQAARKGQDWMVLGDLMGGIVMTATLVLGIVALISPIEIADFSPFAIARIFLIISALFFLFFIKTDRKISKKEGIISLMIYVIFLITEILTK
jgi:cation:H+ antiporter